jgi:branched-chain amino acid transport system substrate-binding protein
MKFRHALLATAAVFALGATAAQAQIVIATAGPMTGQYATFGEQMRRGAEMAVKDINAAGGIMGQQIQLQIGDDACDPKQAVAVANNFVNQKVKFVAGHFCSGSSIPASQVYNEEGILQMSPASTNPKLTEQGFKNVFRSTGRDDQQGQVAGDYVSKNYKGKNIAILHDKSAYGKGLADETQKALNAAGTKEKLYEAYTAGERDYSALVSKMKQEGVEVVYIGGYHTEAGLITRQMREQGLNAQVISGDALNSQEFWSITGEAGKGFLFTFGPDPRNKPEAQKVVQQFKAAGYDPEGYTLYTYASIQAYKQAVETAKSTDMAKVADALRAGIFDTVIGKLDFNDKGDLTTPQYVFYRWENGNYKEIN